MNNKCYYYYMKNRSKTDIIGRILESVNSAAGVGEDYDNNHLGLTKSVEI